MGRLFDQNMIQCCTCMDWIHQACAELSDNHNGVIWNCVKCRQSTATLTLLTNHVDEIKIQLTRLCDLNENLLGQLSKKTLDYDNILQENIYLKQCLLKYEQNEVDSNLRKKSILNKSEAIKNQSAGRSAGNQQQPITEMKQPMLQKQQHVPQVSQKQQYVPHVSQTQQHVPQVSQLLQHVPHIYHRCSSMCNMCHKCSNMYHRCSN